MRFAKTPLILAIIAAVGWWGISMMRSPEPSSMTADQKVDLKEDQKADAALQAAITPPSLARAPVLTPAPERPKPIKFEFQKELNSYAALKTKVLPSPEEKAARESLLKNAPFLRSLGQRLIKIPLMELGEQDAALDLLVEALEKGDKATATGAIADIVEDRQVENETLPTQAREQLAGIKAELLFHWTAIAPDQASQVPRMLPGPVSKKIWDNVLEAQKNNLAASAAESR